MQFDYESIRDRIIDDLRSKASWATILPFSVNRRIIDAVASGISELAAYDEYLTRESKWDIAQNVSSLVLDAKFRGYDVHRKNGATGNIRISASSSFDSTPSKIIDIPKYTTFSDGEDIKFATTSANNILTTDNYVDVAVVQGTPTSVTWTAEGTTYETFELDNDSVEDSIYEVYVNDVLWTEVSDLNESDEDDTVYTLKNTPNLDGIEIQFGNNIFGKKLTVGDTVLFKYIDTLGIEGNVVSSGIIDTVESTVYDIDSDVATIYCTNTESLDGGTEEEDIDDIRSNGVDTFQAGEKIVSKTDYEVKLLEKSFVHNVIAWGSYEANLLANNDPWTAIGVNTNNVYVSAYTPAGENLSEEDKLELSEFVNPDKSPEDIMSFVEAKFILLAFNITAYVSSEEYTLSEVKAAIISALQASYDIETNDFFGHIYDTAWKKIISDVAGVSYHNSYIEIIEYDSFTSAYSATIELPIIDIKTETVKIYVSETGTGGTYTLIGTDDGAGGFTAETGYDLTGSTVNYETGAVSLTVVSGLTADYDACSIKTYYQTEDENDEKNIILNAMNQVVKIEEVTDITTQYRSTLGD